jgi:hypothetical protein
VTPFLAVAGFAARAFYRSHPLRAFWVVALLATLAGPSLVAFAFSGADAFAAATTVGTACLFPPLATLAAGLALAAGERGGEGIAPLLRGTLSLPATLAAVVAGTAAAAVAAALPLGAAAAWALADGGAPGWAGPALRAAASAAAAAPAGAAAGILLGSAAPRPLAAALALLLLVALAPAADGILLARDAAFGPLPARAAILAAAASLAAAVAAGAAAAAILRAKDCGPRPSSP